MKKRVQKPKGKYFHCGKDGHWKRNCITYLAEKQKEKEGNKDKQGNDQLLFIEACFVTDSFDT